MKHYHYLLSLFLLILVACNKQHDQVMPTSSTGKPAQPEKYAIVEIKFDAIASASEESLTEERPYLIFSNKTTLRQQVDVNPELAERSTFQRDPDGDFTIDDANQQFSVPLTIVENQISLGAKKWPYREEEVKLPAQLSFKDVTYVDPNKKLTVKLSIIYKKIKAGYTATLKGLSSGKLTTIKGTWTGIYPEKDVVTYSTESI